MKISATQFARLTELLAKGSALTDEEKTEKASIESQIVAEEDGETGGEGEGETGGEGETPPAGDESDESDQSDDSDLSDESDQSDETEKKPADPVDDEKAFARLSIGDKFRALTASRVGLLNKLSAAAAQMKTLGAELVTMTQRATAAETALAEAQASLATSQARVATLEADAKDLNTAVTDELAGTGVDRKELVATDPQGKGGAVEAAYDDFRSAKTPEDKAAAHKRLKALQAKSKEKVSQN